MAQIQQMSIRVYGDHETENMFSRSCPWLTRRLTWTSIPMSVIRFAMIHNTRENGTKTMNWVSNTDGGGTRNAVINRTASDKIVLWDLSSRTQFSNPKCAAVVMGSTRSRTHPRTHPSIGLSTCLYNSTHGEAHMNLIQYEPFTVINIFRGTENCQSPESTYQCFPVCLAHYLSVSHLSKHIPKQS